MDQGLGGYTMKVRNWRGGFTLIELMVVVIIIAALAAMVVPHLLPAGDDAKRKIAKGDISSISLALKMYRLHYGRYPTTSEGLSVLNKPGTTAGWKEPYLEKEAIDPWKNPYKYRSPGIHGVLGFDIWSAGKDGQDGTDDDVSSWKDE
jgi:general secretion pathway protein G